MGYKCRLEWSSIGWRDGWMRIRWCKPFDDGERRATPSVVFFDQKWTGEQSANYIHHCNRSEVRFS